MSWGRPVIERNIKECEDYNILTIKEDGKLIYEGRADFIEETYTDITFINGDGEKVTIIYGTQLTIT